MSLSQLLSDLIDDQRPLITADSQYDEESNDKLEKIEIELDEIAQNVKKNISSIFERGEKFGVLAQKSEQLKTTVSDSDFMINSLERSKLEQSL